MLPRNNQKKWTGQSTVTLTYDDGRTNNYDIALPLHERHGIPAVFAIIAGRTLDPSWWYRHMKPWQVMDAAKRGVEISSHGYDHQFPLTELSDEALARELSDSKEALEGIIGSNVSTFCVPFSAYDDRVLNLAQSTYDCVRVAGAKHNLFGLKGNKVNSFSVRNDTSLEDVRGILQAGIRSRSATVLMFHGVEEVSPAKGKYNTSRGILRGILETIASIGEDELLPITLAELASLSSGKRQAPVEIHTTPPSREPKRSAKTKEPLHARDGVVLADHRDYMITFYPAETSDKLVISFGGLPSKRTKSGFGSRFIIDQGWNHVFVAQREGSQYQGLSLDDFRRALEPVADGLNVVTYGSSLGAYCALYYAGCLDALAIASAPKNSAHPAMRKARFKHIDFIHEDFKNIPLSSKPPVILYDPYQREETDFIDTVIAPVYPNAVRLEFPFAGHTVLNTLKVNGVLKSFVRGIIEGGVVAAPSLRTHECPIWNAEVARMKLMRGDIEEARSLLQRSLELGETTEAVKLMVRLKIKEGDNVGAQRFIDQLAAGGRSDLVPRELEKKVRLLARGCTKSSERFAD